MPGAAVPFTRLFGVSARFEAQTFPPIVVENLHDDGLKIEWEVKKTNKSSKLDTMDCTIYGLHPKTRQALANYVAVSAFPTFNIKCRLSIGWDGQVMTLFEGQITSIQPDKEEKTTDAAEAATKFKVDDGIDLATKPAVVGNLAALGMSLIIAKIAADLKLTYSVAAKAAIAKAAKSLPHDSFKSYTASGGRELLDQLFDTLGLSWSIQGGRLVVFEVGINNEVLPFTLGQDSGLLTWSITDKGAIKAKALAIPLAIPGGQVTIIDKDGKPVTGGPVRIEKATFKGSTDHNSLMTLVCQKLKPI